MDENREHDPFRALDGLEPPGDWDDVEARASTPAAAPTDLGARRSVTAHRVLAVAAAVILLGGVATAVAVAGDDPGAEVRTTNPDHTTTTPTTEPAKPTGSDDPAGIWGRTWQVERIVHEGQDWPVNPAPATPFRLDLRTEGQISFFSCNSVVASSTVDLDGDRLVFEPHPGPRVSPLPKCADSAGSQLGAQEDILQDLIASNPRVDLQGDWLALVMPDGNRIEAVDASAYEPPTAFWNHDWKVKQLVVDGRPTPVGELVLRAGDGGVSLSTCNSTSAAAAIDGEVLQIEPIELPQQCRRTDEAGQAASDALLGFLGRDLVVAVRGDRLVLSRGTSRLEAVHMGQGSTTTTTSEPAPVTTTSITPIETTTTTAPQVTTTVPDGPMDDLPDELYIGPFWDQEELHLTWLTDGGEEQPFGPMTVVDTRGGAVRVAGCNGAGGPMKLEDRGPEGFFLVKDGDWPATTKACLGDEGKLLMDRDAWFDAFLRSGPSLTWDGDAEFTLTSGDRIVKLVYGGI